MAYSEKFVKNVVVFSAVNFFHHNSEESHLNTRILWRLVQYRDIFRCSEPVYLSENFYGP